MIRRTMSQTGIIDQIAISLKLNIPLHLQLPIHIIHQFEFQPGWLIILITILENNILIEYIQVELISL